MLFPPDISITRDGVSALHAGRDGDPTEQSENLTIESAGFGLELRGKVPALILCTFQPVVAVLIDTRASF